MATKKLSALEKLAGRAAPLVDDAGKAVAVPLDKIRFDSTQPRQAFHHPDGQVAESDEMAVQELAESIEAQGLIHPITVEPVGDGTFRVVVGERRTRALLKLGRGTILAKVREDLVSAKKRLVYQLAENVNRADLTDADMARSIRSLMEGNVDEPPMTQSLIAKSLGKSEGWVSRYVKFGDDDQQRLWVLTGIADTVEKLYRLSVLPMPVQVDIQRRVQLPVDHPDYLETPLNRGVIDEFSRAAKVAKAASAYVPPPAMAPAMPKAAGNLSTGEAAASAASAHSGLTLPTSAPDAVPSQLALLAQAGHQSASHAPGGPQKSPAPSDGDFIGSPNYALPAADRAAILGAAGVTLQQEKRSEAQPPVSVRVPMSCLQRLIRKLSQADGEVLNNIQLNVTLPGPLAERIANVLTGVVVDQREVPAVVQNELVKLR